MTDTDWVMVPREPTEAMLDAATGVNMPEHCWRSMLAAAPQPAPSREPLTEKQIRAFANVASGGNGTWMEGTDECVRFARAVEAVHGIGGSND